MARAANDLGGMLIQAHHGRARQAKEVEPKTEAGHLGATGAGCSTVVPESEGVIGIAIETCNLCGRTDELPPEELDEVTYQPFAVCLDCVRDHEATGAVGAD